MRPLLSRRAATAAVCATLILGTAGPAVAASHAATEAAALGSALSARHDAGVGTPRAPLPTADALGKQVKPLTEVAGVLTPVTALVTEVLKADNGKLPAADAAKHSAAIKDALALVGKAAPAAPVTPGTPIVPGTPIAPLAPKPAVPGPEQADDHFQTLPADAKSDALAAVRKSTDGLVKATAAAAPADVLAQIQAVLASLITLLTNLLSGVLPDLPALPATPGAPKLPTVPTVPQLPVTPGQSS
ncbi:hypothetical protein ACIO1C_20325 [Streptomyces sp. NPDC087420]|uniref:hypothetical protein n=1 Tax=Streptomyces sp. NPDC087420 TaxID=3365785 RepID=UPI003838E4BF